MKAETGTVLIVEDEWKIARFIQMELAHEGYITEIETNGRRALDRISQENFGLVLLDVMLPDIDGVEVCRRVREISSVPIIMVSAKDEIDARVRGLDNGADDYITKPFAIQELLARIRATLRKHRTFQNAGGDTELRLKNLALFPSRYEVQVDTQPVELTKKEYDLLEYLVRNKNVVLDRDKLLREVWGYDYAGDSNVVDVYVRYLRSKLDDRFAQKYIHTVRGVGYVVKD
jgi:DNA-binding response OmpR family regulator